MQSRTQRQPGQYFGLSITEFRQSWPDGLLVAVFQGQVDKQQPVAFFAAGDAQVKLCQFRVSQCFGQQAGQTASRFEGSRDPSRDRCRGRQDKLD